MGKLLLTLRSDLCAGSGKGYSSIIDTDINYDSCGVPFIPARRIKGVLREAATLADINETVIDRIFGTAAETGTLRIGNGYLSGYAPQKTGLVPERVTDLFTYVRAQTSLKDGRAADETLRFTRVMKRNLPWSEEAAVFEFDCTVDDDSSEHFKNICLAVRHIGMHRNRGLGAVSCVYKGNCTSCSAGTTSCNENSENDDSQKKCNVFAFTLYLQEPVIIAVNDSNETANYIPGKAILGAAAGMYGRQTQASQEEMDDLFFSGKLCFSNLYIAKKQDEAFTPGIPAPHFLMKIKSGDEKNDVIYSVCDKDRPLEYEYKPLRGKMVGRDDFGIRKVETKIVYHHSTSSDAMLYTQTSICEGQYFTGCISGDPEAVHKIGNMLMAARTIRVGRSKSAQYSNCKIVMPEYLTEEIEKVACEAGTVLFALESDVIAPDLTSLFHLLKLPKDAEIDKTRTSLQFCTIHGYNSTRQLRDIPEEAIAKGSVLAVVLSAAEQLPRTYSVGRRTAEGFGCIRLYTPDETKPTMNEKAPTNDDQPASENSFWVNVRKLISAEDAIDAVRKSAYEYFSKNCVRDMETKKNDYTASFISRLTLMVENAESDSDLTNRINGIKTKTKKAEAQKIAKAVSYTWEQKRLWLLTVLRFCKYQCKLTGAEEASE